jgi:hypothetical protein
MTDRLIAFTVTLEAPIRDDDAEPIAEAIRMIKGVADVAPVVASPEAYWARDTARRELLSELIQILRRPVKGDEG